MNEAKDKKYIINQWIISGFFMAVAFAALVGLKHGNTERNEINFEFFIKALIPSLIIFPLGSYFVGKQQWETIMKKRLGQEAQLPVFKKQLDEQKIIKFELAKISKNIYKNYHNGALLVLVIFFIFFFVFGLKTKHGFLYSLQFPSIFCGVLYILVLLGVYRTWRARMAYELSFDQEKKEFSALIIDRKEVIKFMVKDIKEVGKEPRQGGFRFYLNDGKWITWDSAFTNKEGDLDNLVRSLGISVRIISFW